eukprot:scaffold499_cov335-Pavlova_lutheri.AAC.17
MDRVLCLSFSLAKTRLHIPVLAPRAANRSDHPTMFRQPGKYPPVVHVPVATKASLSLWRPSYKAVAHRAWCRYITEGPGMHGVLPLPGSKRKRTV